MRTLFAPPGSAAIADAPLLLEEGLSLIARDRGIGH